MQVLQDFLNNVKTRLGFFRKFLNESTEKTTKNTKYTKKVKTCINYFNVVFEQFQAQPEFSL